jgi:hypothetical protein
MSSAEHERPVEALGPALLHWAMTPSGGLHSALNTANRGHDRVFQVILGSLVVGRGSTPLGFADAFRLNATVPRGQDLAASLAGSRLFTVASPSGYLGGLR